MYFKKKTIIIITAAVSAAILTGLVVKANVSGDNNYEIMEKSDFDVDYQADMLSSAKYPKYDTETNDRAKHELLQKGTEKPETADVSSRAPTASDSDKKTSQKEQSSTVKPLKNTDTNKTSDSDKTKDQSADSEKGSIKSHRPSNTDTDKNTDTPKDSDASAPIASHSSASEKQERSSDTKAINTTDTDRTLTGNKNTESQKLHDESKITNSSVTLKNAEISSRLTDSDKNTSSNKTEQRKPPEKYQIKISHLSQINVLPTGCEIVSTKTILDYYGKNPSYDELLSKIPRQDLKVTKDGKLYGASPFEAFIGDPKKNSGFGCYPDVIEILIRNLNYPDLYTESTNNLPLDFIAKTYTTQDIPVLVWATIGMGDSALTDTWYTENSDHKPSKEKYKWRCNEHCLVLIGYDKQYYYFSDPLSYNSVKKYEKKIVEKRYKEVGSYSLLIRQKDN